MLGSSSNDAVNAAVAACERRVSQLEHGPAAWTSAPQREHRMDSADWIGIGMDHSTPLCNTRDPHAAGNRVNTPIVGSYSR